MANYHAVIKSNALAFSKNNNTPSVKLMLAADRDLDSGNPVQKSFYADLWLSEKAKERTINTLREIGYNGSDFMELNKPCLAGYEVEISTEFEDYNGRSYEKVSFVNKVGNFENRGIKAIDDAQAKRLAANINAMFRNVKPTSQPHIAPGTKNTAPAQSNAFDAPAGSAQEPDDGLPF